MHKTFLAFCCLAVSLLLAETGASPVYQKDFIGTGTREFEFTLGQWGRFSIQVASPEGVELQLKDKKQGIRGKDGVPGEANGRIDEFLDIGPYKIIANAAHKASAQARLTVVPFTELNAPSYMVELKRYETNLKDLEQRSYWIHIPRDTVVFIEALGRNVGDIQLWRNGRWRVNISRLSIKSLERTDTPLKGYRVVQPLQSGYYLLTVYGGPPLDWTRTSDKHPAYISWGLEQLGSNGKRTEAISKRGYNHYIVPADLDYAVLSTPQDSILHLSAVPFDKKSSRFTKAARDSIHPKSIDRRCIVRMPNRRRSSWYVLRVKGTPGQVFTLTTLSRTGGYTSESSGDYWISTLHTSLDDAQFGVSGFITDDSKRKEIVVMTADTVSSAQSINREFNLLAEMSAFVWIEENGNYTINPGGVAYSISIERYFVDGKSRKMPAFDGKRDVKLTKGLYKLRFKPRKKGIATLQFHKTDLLGKLSSLVQRGEKPEPGTGKAYIQIPRMFLSSGTYRVIFNNLAPEKIGTIIRKLPMDIEEPLPVKTEPNVSITLPVTVKEQSELLVKDERGEHRRFVLNGNGVQSPHTVKPGQFTLQLSGSGDYLHVQSIPTA
ncbi:MAG: hypothetical protein GF344_06175, partial [Chitinivibrionales bacterium]|nr:hypothetical protein [Chitinivibrionales bacterium]